MSARSEVCTYIKTEIDKFVDAMVQQINGNLYSQKDLCRWCDLNNIAYKQEVGKVCREQHVTFYSTVMNQSVILKFDDIWQTQTIKVLPTEWACIKMCVVY